VEMDLCEIATGSDVVTLATIDRCKTDHGSERCQLGEHQDFKGTASEGVCTDVSFVESRPLSGFAGKQVLLFLQHTKGCFSVTGANRGVVPVVGTTAYTVSLRDLSQTTELSELVGKLRECVGK